MRTWVEINLDNIKHNVQAIKALLPDDCLFMAVVKANGYGHGAIEVAKAAIEAGANRLGVAILEEAKVLRQAQINVPIQLLTGFEPGQAKEIAQFNLIPTIYTKDHLDELAALDKAVKVHVKVDTGMGRIGLKTDEVALFLTLAKAKNIEVEGLFTHFATADVKNSQIFERQLTGFEQLIDDLKKEGLAPKINHAANSAATILKKQSHMQMVRVGIALYGLHPSGDTKDKIDLKPALSWFAGLSYAKKLTKGDTVSYGATHTIEKEGFVGTVPVGYADGYNRNLSNNSEVIVNGQKITQIGRVCMDQFMVYLKDVQAKVGDKVTLIGQDGRQKISADDLAAKLGTINYEIVCAIATRVPRYYK